MVANRKVTGKAASMPVGLAMGAAVSVGVTLTMSAMAARLVYSGRLDEKNIGYCAMVVLILSALLGATVSEKKIKRRKLIVCGASGLIYYTILLITTAILFGGEYRGMGTTALIVLCGCGVAALLGTRQGRGAGRTGRRKVRHS